MNRTNDTSKSEEAREDLGRNADFVLEPGDEVSLAPADLRNDGGNARSPRRGDQPVPRAMHASGDFQRVVQASREGAVEVLEAGLPRLCVIQATGQLAREPAEDVFWCERRFFMSSIGRPTSRRMPRSVKLTCTPLVGPMDSTS
jgi:hypothetical protein